MSGDAPVPLSNGTLLLASSNSFPTGILVALILLLLASAFFSATETAFTSSNKIRLRTLSANGNRRAAQVLDLVENKFDKLISVLLIGNNIVNLSASTLCVLFFQQILKDGVNYSLISTIVITVAVLIFGEITPKYIGKLFSEKLAMAFYPIVICLYYLLYPVHFLFGGFKWIISKIFRATPDDKITEDEIMTVVEEAEEDGTLRNDETKLIRSVIEFDDLEVGDILVPRVNIVAVDVSSSMEDIKQVFNREGYSRIPVYKDTIDTIIGTIHEKDFFNAYLAGKKTVDGIMQNAFYTTEHAKISKLLKQLQKKKVHIAVVLDEYGGTLGIVTLEDVLEELVGEIWDEHDEEVDYFKKVGDNSYLIDGNAPLGDVFEFLDIKDEKENFDASTLSGWLIEYLGEIPHIGKKITYLNIEFEIVKSTVKRILQVKVTILPPPKEEEKEKISLLSHLREDKQ